MHKSKLKKLEKLVLDNFQCPIAQKLYGELQQSGFRDYEEYSIKKYVKKKDKILDLGCGTGRVALALTQLGYTDITGIDLVPKMIEIAKKNTQTNKVRYETGNATNLRFANNTFDSIIFSYNGWSQIPGKNKRQKALNEVRRTLKQDGIFIFSALVGNSKINLVFRWLKFKIKSKLGKDTKLLDFGDTILYRYGNYKKKYYYNTPQKSKKNEDVMKIYIHYSSFYQLKIDLIKTGFNILEIKDAFKCLDYKQKHFICQKI